MATRAAPGQRAGARFAQFKLVLLGMLAEDPRSPYNLHADILDRRIRRGKGLLVLLVLASYWLTSLPR